MRFLCAFAHETAGAARTRLSLRPLLHERAKDDAKLGRIAPRECGRVSASLFDIESEIDPRVVPVNAGTLTRQSIVRKMTALFIDRRGGVNPGVRRDDAEWWHASARALLQRDREPAQIRVGHQPDLLPGQFQHRALLVGQHDGAGAAADREAGAGRAIDAGDIGGRLMLLTRPRSTVFEPPNTRP